jgi:hypothetical protein
MFGYLGRLGDWESEIRNTVRQRYALTPQQEQDLVDTFRYRYGAGREFQPSNIPDWVMTEALIQRFPKKGVPPEEAIYIQPPSGTPVSIFPSSQAPATLTPAELTWWPFPPPAGAAPSLTSLPVRTAATYPDTPLASSAFTSTTASGAVIRKSPDEFIRSISTPGAGKVAVGPDIWDKIFSLARKVYTKAETDKIAASVRRRAQQGQSSYLDFSAVQSLSTGAKVGLSLGALAVIGIGGFLIYRATRK